MKRLAILVVIVLLVLAFAAWAWGDETSWYCPEVKEDSGDLIDIICEEP